ncbi:MAG TPA: L,D-transpeptidase family protein [Candidatus Limnocylindria bacterium]|nr:L,D-transpeptidase family protein [Candidatus Limnocylindria bacterium]
MLGRSATALALALALATGARAEPARSIRVNIPAFTLQVLDGTEVVLEMPVVVGRPSRPTPVFERVLSAIVVHPAWSIPPDLAFHDVLPRILAEPGHLDRRGIDVYESWAPGAARLDPAEIDWRTLDRGIETLLLRQRPGPANGLGRLLFRLDGERDIFLHDTPARAVFRQANRALSSGCIRLADAEALARAVLDDAGQARLTSALARSETTTIPLVRPVPVRTVYDTTWVDRRGVAHVARDVYALGPRTSRAAVPATPVRRAAAWAGGAVHPLTGWDPSRSARRTAAAAR